MRLKSNSDRGFTLVELIVVLVVLSMGLVTLMLLMRQISTDNMRSHHLSIAQGLAEEKMDEVVDGGFSAAAIGSTVESSIANFGDYTRTTTVTYVPRTNLNGTAGGATNFKRINIQITSKAGVIATPVELVTLLTDAT